MSANSSSEQNDPATVGPVKSFAFLGPAGTFSHAAARALVAEIPNTAEIPKDAEIPDDLTDRDSSGGQHLLCPYPTVTQAVDALRAGEVDGAVVPLENSVEGAVPATLDELANGHALVILAETFLPVIFDLLARPGTRLTDIKTVATHPHAEAQVRRTLLELLPLAQVVMMGSTAAGAQSVHDGLSDAAVAPPIAGGLYALDVLAHDIADNPGAVTRFVLLGHPTRPEPPTGNDRTSLVTYLQSDHSGALLEILTEFAARGINLTRIESRPTKERIGQYCFSIDCEGHIAEARVGAALASLRRICADVRYLGSYPRKQGHQGPVLAGRSDADFERAKRWLEGVRSNGTDNLTP